MKTRLFLSAVVFMALTAVASAQTTQTTQQDPVQAGKGRAAGKAWVDADKNGVCDNYESGNRIGRRAYSAGENQATAGRGAGRGQRLAQGPGNGRGNRQGMAAGRGAGRGQANAPGRGRFNGQGPAFIDADKNGVCDNLETATVKK
jgi:hypothetical protein